MYDKTCQRCEKPFVAKRSHARFCCANCQQHQHSPPRKTQQNEQNEVQERLCAHCGFPIPPARLTRSWVKFCSPRCARQNATKKAPQGEYPDLTSPTVGAVHELQVAADLLVHGYAVFRALSPSCDCDLAALLGSKLIRVEVTTGYKAPSGKITYPKHDPQLHDALAVVAAKTIHYFPPLEQWPSLPC